MEKRNTVHKSFLEAGSRLYETIYSPALGVTGYYFFDRTTGERGFVEEVLANDISYRPPQNNMAETGVMLFPEKTAQYGTVGDLLESIKVFINKYLELPDDSLLIASCYVLLSWVHDCFDTIPYLRSRGEYGTGKSRFLRVIGSLCYRPLFAGGSSTTSPIFRLIEMYEGLTLVLDEADFRFSGPDAEIIKILNTGYMKGVGVLRTEGDKIKVPKSYRTYGPKILATRKEFEDQALESRCLTTYMQGRTRTDVPIVLPRSFTGEALSLRNQLLRFRFEHYGSYEIDPDDAIEEVEARVNQVLMPLFVLTEDTGIRSQLRNFALKHAQQQAVSRSTTVEADVLFSLVELARESPTIAIKKLAEKVNENRDTAQGEYRISPSKIGRINRTSFGFATRKVMGVTEILWQREKARSLCHRYNIPIPTHVEQVDLVDQVRDALVQTPDQALVLQEGQEGLHGLQPERAA